MECSVFGVCGGCVRFESSADALFEAKKSAVAELFSGVLDGVEIETFLTKDAGFRARAEFRFVRARHCEPHAVGRGNPLVKSVCDSNASPLFNAIDCHAMATPSLAMTMGFRHCEGAERPKQSKKEIAAPHCVGLAMTDNGRFQNRRSDDSKGIDTNRAESPANRHCETSQSEVVAINSATEGDALELRTDSTSGLPRRDCVTARNDGVGDGANAALSVDCRKSASRILAMTDNDNSALKYAVNELGKNSRCAIDTCPAVLESIQNAMARLLESINNNEILKHKLYAVSFLSVADSSEDSSADSKINSKTDSKTDSKTNSNTDSNADSGAVAAALIYHTTLSDGLKSAISQTAESTKIKLQAIAKNEKFGEATLTEKIKVGDKILKYARKIGRFSQPNPFANTLMLNFVARFAGDLSTASTSDLLELYCGSGNFTIALAPYFRKVFATEVVKDSIKMAEQNLAENHITNATIARLNAHETMEALSFARPFFRLRGVDLSAFNFSAILVDPPRAGINDAATLDFMKKFPYIIYISCNPLSLRADVESLLATHRPIRFALFDQFPYTQHVESIMILARR